MRRIIFMQSLIRRYLARKRYLAIRACSDFQICFLTLLLVAHKAEKRGHIVKEIVETEQSYLHGLRTCVAVFMEPLQQQQRDNPKTAILPPDKIQTLFGNMPVRAPLSTDSISPASRKMLDEAHSPFAGGGCSTRPAAG